MKETQSQVKNFRNLALSPSLEKYRQHAAGRDVADSADPPEENVNKEAMLDLLLESDVVPRASSMTNTWTGAPGWSRFVLSMSECKPYI
jgi:hypothetical protein